MDNTSGSYLKNLNKASHKISKPTRKPFPLPLPDSNPLLSGQAQQPPVYNINKNDFRDVVQKLTGSPAHDRSPPPPPPTTIQPRPSSSRLQRIRPPPLVQITNRPPNDVVSLLPPLPSVHHAAESPISAYMRVLQGSSSPVNQNDVALTAGSPISAYMRFLQNSVYSSTRPPPPTEQPSSPFPSMLLSPLPFGCVPSPRSQYGMLNSPGLLFSPTGGPLSPTVPLPSPRWKGI